MTDRQKRHGEIGSSGVPNSQLSQDHIDKHNFYDGALLGIAEGNAEIRNSTLKWAREHVDEITADAQLGILTAKSMLQILKNIK